MQRVATGLVAVILLTILLVPPWRVSWVPDATAGGPGMAKTTWAGFHSWAYAKERPTRTIAWDGPNTGGHIPLSGTPHVAYALWASLLCCATAGLVLVARARHSTFRPPPL